MEKVLRKRPRPWLPDVRVTKKPRESASEVSCIFRAIPICDYQLTELSCPLRNPVMDSTSLTGGYVGLPKATH